ncbi:MAG TPA: TraR/DksA family transcriptional regulator [Gemmatimonadales bacterium]|jgi:RNA polymerase-binding transcription factor DksA
MSLSAAQLKHFEERLLEERSYTLQSLNQIVATSSSDDEETRAGDLSAYPTHLADRGTDTMDDELAASNATRISGEIAEIDAALERLAASPAKFGICEDTGKPIPLERLEIIPWARTCNA